MSVPIARWVVALVGAGLVVIAVFGLIYAYTLMTLEGDEGGATIFGLLVLAIAAVVGLFRIGLLALIRR